MRLRPFADLFHADGKGVGTEEATVELALLLQPRQASDETSQNANEHFAVKVEEPVI